jgi:hypothetical protein
MQVRPSAIFSELPVLYTTGDLPCFVPYAAHTGGSPWAYLSLPWPSAGVFDALLPSLVLESAVGSATLSLRRMRGTSALAEATGRKLTV